MKVTLLGGTGFVGSYLVDKLVEHGVEPRLLVRPGRDHRVRHADRCEVVHGDVTQPPTVSDALEGSDAVIYNIGILREVPSQHISFEELHFNAARRVMNAAAQLGIRRFVLMSANGVRETGTLYQQTKFRAEQALWESGLDGTVVRPSVIFGDPRGRMEFATQLLDDIIDPPIPAPLFFPGFAPTEAGTFSMSPVHVDNVAEAFCRILLDDRTIGQTLHLGGPESLSWREILERIAMTVGKNKPMLPVPALGVSAVATLFDRFARFPVTREQLAMLLEGNSCDSEDLRGLGIDPIAFDATALSYLLDDRKGVTACRKHAA